MVTFFQTEHGLLFFTNMALVTVHSTPLVREFQSTWFSRATFFTLFCFILCLICPLLVAYSTQGFWLKYQVHRERPTVSFKYQALLLAKGKDGSEITWSTFSEYNALTSHYLSYPSISVMNFYAKFHLLILSI